MLERYLPMYMYTIQENEYMHEEYEREGYVRIYRETYIQYKLLGRSIISITAILNDILFQMVPLGLGTKNVPHMFIKLNLFKPTTTH